MTVTITCCRGAEWPFEYREDVDRWYEVRTLTEPGRRELARRVEARQTALGEVTDAEYNRRFGVGDYDERTGLHDSYRNAPRLPSGNADLPPSGLQIIDGRSRRPVPWGAGNDDATTYRIAIPADENVTGLGKMHYQRRCGVCPVSVRTGTNRLLLALNTARELGEDSMPLSLLNKATSR